MESVTCRHCGLPFRVNRVEPGRDYFCCTGCAILARVPVDAEGNYPVNSALVSAIAVGFLYFNQLLAWAVSSLVAREGKPTLSDRFAWISAAAALVVWITVFVLQRRAGVSRMKDYGVAVLTLVLLASSLRALPPSGVILAAANLVFVVWSFRGLVRTRKRRD